MTEEQRKEEQRKKIMKTFAMQCRMAAHTFVVLINPYYRAAAGMWEMPAPGVVLQENHLFVLNISRLHKPQVNLKKKNKQRQDQVDEVREDERKALLGLSQNMENAVKQAGAFNSFIQNSDPYCKAWDLAKSDLDNSSVWDFSDNLRKQMMKEKGQLGRHQPEEQPTVKEVLLTWFKRYFVSYSEVLQCHASFPVGRNAREAWLNLDKWIDFPAKDVSTGKAFWPTNADLEGRIDRWCEYFVWRRPNDGAHYFNWGRFLLWVTEKGWLQGPTYKVPTEGTEEELPWMPYLGLAFKFAWMLHANGALRKYISHVGGHAADWHVTEKSCQGGKWIKKYTVAGTKAVMAMHQKFLPTLKTHWSLSQEWLNYYTRPEAIVDCWETAFGFMWFAADAHACCSMVEEVMRMQYTQVDSWPEPLWSAFEEKMHNWKSQRQQKAEAALASGRHPSEAGEDGEDDPMANSLSSNPEPVKWSEQSTPGHGIWKELDEVPGQEDSSMVSSALFTMTQGKFRREGAHMDTNVPVGMVSHPETEMVDKDFMQSYGFRVLTKKMTPDEMIEAMRKNPPIVTRAVHWSGQAKAKIQDLLDREREQIQDEDDEETYLPVRTFWGSQAETEPEGPLRAEALDRDSRRSARAKTNFVPASSSSIRWGKEPEAEASDKESVSSTESAKSANKWAWAKPKEKTFTPLPEEERRDSQVPIHLTGLPSLIQAASSIATLKPAPQRTLSPSGRHLSEARVKLSPRISTKVELTAARSSSRVELSPRVKLSPRGGGEVDSEGEESKMIHLEAGEIRTVELKPATKKFHQATTLDHEEEGELGAPEFSFENHIFTSQNFSQAEKHFRDECNNSEGGTAYATAAQSPTGSGYHTPETGMVLVPAAIAASVNATLALYLAHGHNEEEVDYGDDDDDADLSRKEPERFTRDAKKVVLTARNT